MHIGVLTHNYPRFPGDFSGTFVEALCQELVAQGQQVTVWAPYDPAYRRPLDGHVRLCLYRYAWPKRLHRLGYMRTMRSDLALRAEAYLLSPALFAAGITAVARWAARARPDVLHAHWVLPNGFIGAVVSRRLHIPLVISIPGSDVTVAAQNPLFGWMARFAFRQAGLITANAESLREIAVTRLGAAPDKLELIAYGVAPDALRPDPTGTAALRAQLGIPAQAVVLLAVGRMVYKKGFDGLLRAVASLIGEGSDYQGPPLHLVMVGEGELWAQWQALGRELGLGSRVHWVGNVPVDQMRVYYNMADVAVMPAITKPATGLAVAVLEAMACGKPIIASDAAGNRLAVRDGVNGLIVPEGDEAALASAIALLASDPALRARMGKASRRRIETELGWPALARRYIRHFERLCASGER